MSATSCLKLLLLVSMIPLALRAASLLAGGHGAPAPSSSSSRPSSRDRSTATATSTAAAAATAAATSEPRVVSVHVHASPARQARRRRRAESALAAPDAARRPGRKPDGAGDWFDDDKRLAPTGSNPLHNLR